MDINKLTIKSQELMQAAQQLAQEKGNQTIETGHVLRVMLDTEKDVIPFLLKDSSADLRMIGIALDRIIESYPRVSGGQLYISNQLQQVLNYGFSEMKKFGDEYLSVEVLFFAMLYATDAVGQLLKDNKITQKQLKESINKLRNSESVKSSSQDGSY